MEKSIGTVWTRNAVITEKNAGDGLFKLLRWVVSARSLDETRFNITGMFIEKDGDGYRFVSTDGRRMHILEIAGECVREGLAWIDCLREGRGCYNMEIERITAKEIMLGSGIDAAYPNYRKVVPEKRGKNLRHNEKACSINGRFSAVDTRIKLKRLCPQFE
jgi:hypothetical protein